MNSPASELLQTNFASAERSALHELERQSSTLKLDELVDAFMQAMPGYVMLLNKHRQIVAVNPSLLCVTGTASIVELLGKRPGEALNCVNACTAPNGCGTDEHCSVCGAVLAIIESQQSGRQASRECYITLSGEHEVVQDLLATATPLTVRGELFTVFVLQDISGEKRREVLERTFFHDIINTAGGIHGLATMLAENKHMPAHVEEEYKKWLVTMSGNLVEEIHSQRKLLMAELGEFEPEISMFSLQDIMEEIRQLYQHHDRVPGRVLVVLPCDDSTISSDRSVLRRIIGNMTLNALEATPIGGTVTVSVERRETEVIFSVHNVGEIPRDVQLQLFKRSFSTKSAVGRGIGTYSMKLFGERYLHGRISFASSAADGTVFSFALPL